jgi:outer membrane protein TolC
MTAALSLLAGPDPLSTGRVASADEAAQMRDRFAHEPSVAEMQAEAMRHAGLVPEKTASWSRRARTAALVPDLSVRASLSGSGTLPANGSDPETTGTTTTGDRRSWYLGASANWSLDRLVFPREEINLARETQRLATRRETLLAEVARVYFQRRRLQVELLLHPPADAAARLLAGLRIDELGAILDALTGGAFSRRTGQARQGGRVGPVGPPGPSGQAAAHGGSP